MNIFIAGGGRVGFHLARLLTTEGHDVTVIETDAIQAEQIDYALDASTVHGNAANVLLLQSIGVAEADLFVSVTGSDEINLVSGASAKGLGAKQVVARVDNRTYLEANMLYESIMGIDYILSPDALTAMELANYIEHPGIVASEDFGRGLAQMRQVRVTKSPTTNGRKLIDIIPPGTAGVRVGIINRRGEIIIPHGDDIIEAGDLVTLIGHTSEMESVQKLFQAKELDLRKVFIMGGSSIGLSLAQALEGQNRKVKLFEWNLARCNELAAQLKKTKVVCRDAASRIALEQEHVDGADVFVAATSDDERNIMASVLAKELGADMAIAVVHQPDFATLVGKLGIEHAITPRACIANRILKLVHQEEVTSLAVLEEGKVEIIEMAVLGSSPVIGKRLRDIKFPRGALVATILRGEHVIVPTGDDEIHAGDSVVLIAASDSLDAVRKLF